MRRSIFYILMIVILLIPLILIGVACRDDKTEILPPPRPHPPTIQLIAEDVGVTDVLLKISVAQDRYPRTFTLKRDTTIVLTTTLTSQDTVIIDKGRLWGLLPKHTYRYTLIRPLDRRRDEVKNISVTTMDTTSHNFKWTIYTLGRLGSSINDVAIINDTCVWIVGGINMEDSTGQFVKYNAARWDGRMWELKRILYSYQGSNYYSQLYSVFAFGVNDYWVCSNQPMHWDGTQWRTFDLPASIWTGWVNKVWGTNSSNIYIVGANGGVAHYNGSIWQKLESGTSLPIRDIRGSTNSKTGELEILAVASDNYDCKILKISGTTVTQLPDSGIFGKFVYNYKALSGIWFVPGRIYYVAGDFIFTKRNVEDQSLWSFCGYPYYTYSIGAMRGNELNDIVFVCEGGDILHFNGYDWKNYVKDTYLGYGVYHSVAIKGNMIVAVGINYNRDVIAIGRR